MAAEQVLPIVHSNGTSKDELITLRCNVLNHLRDAREAMHQAAPNGRDYYLVPKLLRKVTALHDDRMARLDILLREIEAETQAISDME